MKRLAILLSTLAVPAIAQSLEEIELAKAVLAPLQEISFEENREYCGYLAYDAKGALVATPPTEGDHESCGWEGDQDELTLIISYHTHAAYDPEYGSEWPSVTDIEGDEAEGVDGFVATPGGRLWYVDTTDMIVRQICGVGCLPSDPNFEPEPDGVEISYTYQELLELEGN